MSRIALLATLVAALAAAATAQVTQGSKPPVYKQIHDAAEAGDLEAVKRFVERGADVNAKRGRVGNTPLNNALMRGHADVAHYLLDHGADATLADNSGRTPLQAAAHSGLANSIRRLVDAGAKPNRQGSERRAPIHVATQRGHTDAIRALIELGADPNLQPHRGKHPLDYALARPRPDQATALIEGGARVLGPWKPGLDRVEQAAAKGWRIVVDAALAEVPEPEQKQLLLDTALDGACIGGQVELARFLVNHGASVDRRMVGGTRRIDLAAERDDPKLVNLLVELGADPGEPLHPSLWTPLHFAVNNKAQNAANALLQHGVAINANDALGRTPLHIAAEHGDPKLVTLLIRHAAEIDARDLRGDTPLHRAARAGSAGAARALLNARANPHAENETGATPASIAKAKNNDVIPDATATPARDPAALPENARYVVELLLQPSGGMPLPELRHRVAKALDEGQPPLHILVRHPGLQAERLRRYIDRYPDAMRKRDRFGLLPIHAAAEAADPKTVGALLDAGAPIDDQSNPPKWTPLHFAVSAENAANVQYLLQRGADPALLDGRGLTPSDLATAIDRPGLLQ